MVENMPSKKSSLLKFSDFIGRTDEELKNNRFCIIYIDNDKLFFDNDDLFKKILKLGDYDYICSKNIQVLERVESILESDNFKNNYYLCLMDDFLIKDRSYINPDIFTKSTLVVPLTYTFWDFNLQDKQKIACCYNNNRFGPISCSGLPFLTKDQLDKLNNLINVIANHYGSCTDIEKVILISNYLQRHVQFVDTNNVSSSLNRTYITDSHDIKVGNNVYDPINVLFNHYGVCEGIANASSILLNNPLMNVNVGAVVGSGHCWNYVLIDGKYYYFDNTWAITRNPNQFSESLKANSFDSSFLLFGDDTAKDIKNHNPESIIPNIEQDDFEQKVIKDKQKKLARTYSFSDYDEPIFSSKLKK